MRKPEYMAKYLEDLVATLCEKEKTDRTETRLVGGFVRMNSGVASNKGSSIGRSIESPRKDKEHCL